MTLVVPSVCRAQRIALGTGIVMPVGESRDISNKAQHVIATFVMPTRFAAVSARMDAGFWRSLSHVIPNAIVQTAAVSAGANLATSRIPFGYAIAAVGVYRASMSRTPMRVNTTFDPAFVAGLGARWAPRARIHIFAESRLHHILSDVSPTDYLDVTGGVSVSR